MIEIIYKGEEKSSEGNDDVKLPRNVRQIGECEHYPLKIYVEDFVMAYVKHFSSRKLKYGVLLGDIKRADGNTYIFVVGAVTAQSIVDNDIIFDEDVWTGIYEEIKTYFEDVEIVGWFAALPGILENDMASIQKIHLDNFGGNDRLCLLLDKSEEEEFFYVYDEGGMKKCEGHYIYYEKNEDMQSYMTMHIDETTIPEEYSQYKTNGKYVNVHNILLNQLFPYKKNGKSDNDNSKIIDCENSSENEVAASETKRRHFGPSFAYSASSFMLIAILIGSIAMMNANGQLKELKAAVSNLVGKEQAVSLKNDSENGDNSKPVIQDIAGGEEKVSPNGDEENKGKSDKDSEKADGEKKDEGENALKETSVENEKDKKQGETSEANQQPNQETNQGTNQETNQGTNQEANQGTNQEANQGTNQGTNQEVNQGTSQEANQATQPGEGANGGVTAPSVEGANVEPTAPSGEGANGEQVAPAPENNEEVTASVVPNVNYYTVQKGDSLYDISIRTYGTMNMIQKIKEANALSNENFIREGQTIILP